MVPSVAASAAHHTRRRPARQRSRSTRSSTEGKDLTHLRRGRQKSSTVANVVRKLEEHGAMATPSLRASAPIRRVQSSRLLGLHHGSTTGPRPGRARDLRRSHTQAWAYRQVSLLLRRPPAARLSRRRVLPAFGLLERAARVNEEYSSASPRRRQGRTGSLRPADHRDAGATYRPSCPPTSSRSPTGRSSSDRSLQRWHRPAINAGISVSRVGGAAQTKVIKKLGGASVSRSRSIASSPRSPVRFGPRRHHVAPARRAASCHG